MIPLQMGFRDKHPVTHLAFSPDQGRIAVAQPHAGVTVLDRATGATVAVCPTPRRVTSGLAFVGELLVAATSKGLLVFDAGTGARRALNHASWYHFALLEAAGEELVLTGPRGWVRRCAPEAVANGTFAPIRGHRPLPGRVLAADPNGRAVVIETRSGRPALFDLEGGRRTELDREPPPEPAHLRPRVEAHFCPLGRRFAVNDGSALTVYDPDAPDDEPEPDADTPLVQRAGSNAAVVAPAPRAVLSATFTLRSEKKGEERGWFPPFALAADGRGLLVKRPRNRVQWWDCPTGTRLNEWSWGLEWVTCLAVSADGTTAVAGGRFGRVLIWDLDS